LPAGEALVRGRREGFEVGAKVTVKWHREQFSAVARNCRRDGREFLLGVRRLAQTPAPQPSRVPAGAQSVSASSLKDPGLKNPGLKDPGLKDPGAGNPALRNPMAENQPTPSFDNVRKESPASPPARKDQTFTPQPLSRLAEPPPRTITAVSKSSGNSRRDERKKMESKTVFPKFWRRQHEDDASAKLASAETANPPSTSPEEAFSGPRGDLLAYEDIYRATGIMTTASSYGIHKVVEMLHHERIRELSPDIKRASVLMALEAAGTSLESLLEDATRRQKALEDYESSQRKRLEEFESLRVAENSQIEAELEGIRAHYAERMQKNLDQVAHENDALRNWRMAVQHESQRIAEVFELCGRAPVSASMLPVTSRVGAERASVEGPSDGSRRGSLRPSLLSGD
jgi:hypothetical protein